MAKTNRLPGDRTARETAEDVACVLIPTIHVFDCGNIVTWIPLTGPLDPRTLVLVALADGVSLYQAAYREIRKTHGHLTAHKAAQAIATPEKAWAGFETSKTAIVKRRAAKAA